MENEFTSEVQLEILRAADSIRTWHSLEDRRVCACCRRTFDGAELEIRFDQRGRLYLNCPTPGCPSNAKDWLYETIAEPIKSQLDPQAAEPIPAAC